jgi:diguanylate cyclase (GGDEF)-like protein/PAS domain S-box-containing protein
MKRQPIKLLLIEDDAGDVDLLQEMLSQTKEQAFEMHWADRLQAGLEYLNRSQVDVVLLDLTLPDSHGLESFVKAHTHAPKTPIVVLSGLDDETTAIQAVREGAQDYLVKGEVDGNVLVRAVRYAIERAQGERALRESELKHRTLVEQSLQGIVIVQDAPLRIAFVNATGASISGYAAGELLSMTSGDLMSLMHPYDRASILHQLDACVAGESVPSNGELRILRKDGTACWLEYFASTIEHGGKPAIQAAFIDITERKAAQERLRYNAQHDALTGLPNRTLFTERLERAIQHTEEQKRDLLAVLFLDLDRFKIINDSLGHLAGDQVLVTIARRLETCVRSSDVAARLGGDEFAILLDRVRDAGDATRLAGRILEELARPINLEKQMLFTTTSIGIALSEGASGSAEGLLRDADTAMYRAKAQGRARYEIFEPSMRIEAMERWELESDLHRAIEHQELLIHYQPVVSLISGRITGVEALLRWAHPERGLLAPMEFIPLAEDTGLIGPIGEWVLRTACAQTRAWHQAGYSHLRVAINVSARQFRVQNLPELVEGVLEETGLAPQAVDLEITEGVAIRDDNLDTLNALSAIGMRVLLDDFGLGSSLDCLKYLPLDSLKIDQSFVSGLALDASNQTIVTAIIALAHGLNLEVIAEGVETEQQLAFLRSEGCDAVQGNLFSPPVPAETLEKLLNEYATHH